MKISILIFAFIFALSACSTAKKTEPAETALVAITSDPGEGSPDPSWHADYPKKVEGGKDIVIWMYANKIDKVEIESPDEQNYDHYIKDMTNGLKKIIVKTNPVKEKIALQIKVEADGRLGTYLVKVTETDS
jgi:hypothetical protein